MRKKRDKLAKLLQKKRWNEKDSERIERLLAEIESKARSQSEERQEKIKVLWDLDERQLKAAKNPTERKDIEQKLKAQKLKKLLKSVGKLADDDKIIDRILELRVELKELGEDDKVFNRIFDRIRELVDLVGLQDREIEYLAEFRRDWELIRNHDPQELENLYSASLMSLMRQASYLPKRKGKAAWEYKRHGYKLSGGVGLIEYEFGGAGEAEWRKRPLAGLSGLLYEPTCLDKIFRGGAVKRHDGEKEVFFIGHGHHRILDPGLQRLFGMNRNRFPKNLPLAKKVGRETWYDFRAVTKIMERLLLKGKPPECKTPARGRRLELWPINPDLKMLVLSGIEARVMTIASRKEIIRAFVNVVRRHLPDSAKK